MQNGKQANWEQVRDYLRDVNREASLREVEESLGRKFHSPDFTKARKNLGIPFKQGKRKPSPSVRVPKLDWSQAQGDRPGTPMVTPTLTTADGLTLYSGVIELAKLHGIGRVQKAIEAISSVG